MEPIQDGFHHSQPPPSTAFRSVERSRAAQSRPENGNLRDCRGHRIRRIENILGLGQQDTGSHRVAKQMENHRVCASKDEREDFRTFPPCLRRILQEEGRVLQEPERKHERKSGKEERTLRKGRSIKRQHRLESHSRDTYQTSKRVENDRTGCQKTFGCRMEAIYYCMRLLLRAEEQGYIVATLHRNGKSGEEKSADRKAERHRRKY